VELFCGDVGFFGEKSGLFCGDVGLFCGDVGLFCGDVGLFCGGSCAPWSCGTCENARSSSRGAAFGLVYQCVMSHIGTSHVTYNESCQTIGMSHVTHRNESCHI